MLDFPTLAGAGGRWPAPRFIPIADDFDPGAGLILTIYRDETSGLRGVVSFRDLSPEETGWSQLEDRALGDDLDWVEGLARETTAPNVLVRGGKAVWRDSWEPLVEHAAYSDGYDPAASLGDEILIVITEAWDPPELDLLARVLYHDRDNRIMTDDADLSVIAAVEWARALAAETGRPIFVRDDDRWWRPAWGTVAERAPEPGRPISYLLLA
jgi:hypothetical protein